MGKGLCDDIPLYILGAQTQAESSCRVNASSGIARGPTQFIASTARFVHNLDPVLKLYPMYSLEWGLRAQKVYMCLINKSVPRHKPPTDCDGIAWTVGSYNMGEGGANRTRRRAGTGVWFDGAEVRAPKETRLYTRKVVLQFGRDFYNEGWVEDRKNFVCS